jgi:hypothetical protein
MSIQSFISDYNFIWLFVILVVLIYASLKTIKLPGNDWVLAITSFLLSAILISSKAITNFLVASIPVLTMLLALSFFTLIMLVLIAKDIDPFKKYLAWIGFSLAILIILCLAFNQFPTLNHMLPESSDHGLDKNLREFKDFIYSYDFKASFIFILSIIVVGFFLVKKK